MIFYWGLGDSKSPQVSRTFLSILVDLSDVVVWMVSVRPQISVIIIYSFEFFTSALADGLSLEFEWQQVSSNH